MISPALKRTILAFGSLCILILLPSAPAFAACPDTVNNAGYLTPAGNGSKTGADWNNTCAGFSGSCAISSLVRGCTYYVAKGGTQASPAYCVGDETCNFNTSDSGTSVITIKAPTASNHGTSTGYSGALLGQAVFGPVIVSTDYWTFLGYNDLMTTPSNNTSSYGIMISNGTAGVPTDGTAAIENNGSNNTYKYLDVAGPANTTNSALGDMGLLSNAGGQASNYIGYNHMHDSSVYACCKIAGESNDVIEYNWIERNCCAGGAAHRGGINPAVYYATGNTNLTIRYNHMEDLDGTAYIDWANAPSATATHQNIFIYGNVMSCNTAENTGNNPCAGGDGAISFLGNTDAASIIYDNVKVYNNTIDGLLSSQGQCGINLAGGHSATFENLTIQNNVFSQCSANQPLCGQNGATCTGTTTLDSNTFWASGVAAWGTNSQTVSSNPYASAGNNVAGQNNYELATDTAAWSPLSNITMGGLVETLTIDPVQVTRTSSRGAFQFQNGSGGAPNPPKGLTAVVN